MSPNELPTGETAKSVHFVLKIAPGVWAVLFLLGYQVSWTLSLSLKWLLVKLTIKTLLPFSKVSFLALLSHFRHFCHDFVCISGDPDSDLVSNMG